MVMRNSITLPHIYEWHPLAWAKANCPSYISCTGFLKEKTEEGFIEYYFSDEKDMTWFALKWA
jgi:hypothetical protein